MEKVNQTHVVRKHPVNIKGMAEALQKEAAANETFSAVCHMFALRERARSQVTMGTLKFSTIKEGYSFTKEQLESVLKFLAGLGVGRLEKDNKGRITALKDIQYTLQSIGQAAVAQQEGVTKFSAAKTYKELPAQPKAVEPVPTKEVMYAAELQVIIEGKPIKFEVPKGLTPETLAQLLSQIYKK